MIGLAIVYCVTGGALCNLTIYMTSPMLAKHIEGLYGKEPLLCCYHGDGQHVRSEGELVGVQARAFRRSGTFSATSPANHSVYPHGLLSSLASNSFCPRCALLLPPIFASEGLSLERPGF